MRIIGGSFKGRTLLVPKGLPVRPTTDFAREGLFNVLTNHFDLSNISFLDLYAGTGAMTFEMASRGAKYIVSVDQHAACIRFITTTASKLNIPFIYPLKDNVLGYMKKSQSAFDLIFADPPYHTTDYNQLLETILKSTCLKSEGWLIIEHPASVNFEQHLDFFRHLRYGNVNFSIFQLKSDQ